MLEPWITPGLFQPYATGANPVIDEWTLCLALDAKSKTAKRDLFEQHYSSFIVRRTYRLPRVTAADRGGLCADRGRRPQLDPTADPLRGFSRPALIR